ncbi:MAG: hydrogenase 2 operon protein HybA [Chloroflexi bacterium]|nr:hydrogenase 2 operon protein HybA [Chloroflexota bacterium]
MGKKINRREFLKIAGASVGGLLLTAGAVTASGKEEVRPFKPVTDGYAMLYDATLCVGCRACQNACRRANNKPAELDPTGLYDAPNDLSGDTWTLIKLYKSEDGQTWSFVKRQCMHCIEPACVAACPLGALHITPTGAVAYDKNICFGCRYCMVSCPFGVPRYEWDTTTPYIQKCDFCTSNGRLDRGEPPACVEACPTGALVFGTRSELLAEAHQRIEAHPDRYVDHVYGEHEAGGTHALYLSGVPFEDLGFPQLDEKPLPESIKIPLDYAVPSIIVGMTTFSVAAYLVTRGEEDKS